MNFFLFFWGDVEFCVSLQILANPNHRFNTSSLYKNVALVAWDPAPYAVDLHEVRCFNLPPNGSSSRV